MTTVTGSVRNLRATALPGATLRWQYRSYPAYINGALVSSVEDVVSRADDVGDFSQALTAGDYELTIDGNTNDKWTVSVPNDNNTYDVFDLIVSDVTAIPDAPTLAAVPDATSSVKGKILLVANETLPARVYTQAQLAAWFGVNLLDYASLGADNTGSGDNTAAFAAALAAVPTGGTLWVPPGTYRFTSRQTITRSNIKIVGDFGATLKFDGSTNNLIFIIWAGDNVVWDGVHVDGNLKASNALYLDVGSQNWNFLRANFKNVYADAVNDPGASTITANLRIVRGCQNIHFTQCLFYNATHATAGTRTSGNVVINDFGWTTTADSIYNITFSQCTFDTAAPATTEGASARIHTNAGYTSDVRFDDCRFLNFSHYGVKCPAGTSGVRADNCYFESSIVGVLGAFANYGKDNFVSNSRGVLSGSGSFYYQANGSRGGGASDCFCEITGTFDAFYVLSDVQGARLSNIGARGCRSVLKFLGDVQQCAAEGVWGINVVSHAAHVLTDGSASPANCEIQNVRASTVGGDMVKIANGTGIIVRNAVGVVTYDAGTSGGVARDGGASVNPTVAIASTAIDWASGDTFSKTTSGNITFTFSNAVAGQRIRVKVTAGGAHTVTWPTVTWKAAATPAQTASKTDFYDFYYDGTTYFGEASQNF